MNKICTSIKQSKKLIELGIDVNTADNYYSWHDERYYVVNKDCPYPYSLKEKIPCWSLSALLGLMPRIEHLKPFIDLSPKLDSEGVSIYYHSEDSPYIVKDNLIDAAFEMIVWLKENKKI